jgi:hypothetical protein
MLAGLATLAAIGSLMSSHRAVAQGPPGGLSVNIVNPLPVPVTGTVNVGNLGAAALPVTVNNFPATQNISGTVNVGSLPLVRSVIQNGPGSIPFSGLLLPDTVNDEFTVPTTISGQTVNSLVITEVGGYCIGGNYAAIDVGSGLRYFPAAAALPDGRGTQPIYALKTDIFIKPGRSVQFVWPAGSSCQLGLTGYYVTQ